MKKILLLDIITLKVECPFIKGGVIKIWASSNVRGQIFTGST